LSFEQNDEYEEAFFKIMAKNKAYKEANISAVAKSAIKQRVICKERLVILL
jgi:hypothetical protein